MVAADTTPANTTPANTTPANTTPANTTPANTTPANTTPANTTPAVAADNTAAVTTAPDTNVVESIYENKSAKIFLESFIHNASLNSLSPKEHIHKNTCKNITDPEKCDSYTLNIKQDLGDFTGGVTDGLIDFGPDVDNLGMANSVMKSNAGTFFDKMIEMHNIEVYDNQMKEKEEYKELVGNLWSGKTEAVEDYLAQLLIDYNQVYNDDYELPNEIDNAQEFINENAYDLKRFVKGSYVCKWDDVAGCQVLELQDSSKDNLYCPTPNPEDKQAEMDSYCEDNYGEKAVEATPTPCPDVMFDQEILDLGGFKITIGVILAGVAFKLYQDLEKFKKGEMTANTE